MTWVKERLREYNKGKRTLERYRATLIRDDQKDQTQDELAEIDTVSGMIADMSYAIEWMRTGRRPHSRRGVEIKDAYSRAILMDMDLLPVMTAEPEPEQELNITDRQKRDMARILLRLSERERQCFLLHAVQGLSFAEIAKEIKISKGTVQDYVERAKSKVQEEV